MQERSQENSMTEQVKHTRLAPFALKLSNTIRGRDRRLQLH